MNAYSKLKHKIISNHPDVIDDYTKYINNYGNKTLPQKVRAYTYLTSLLMKHEQKLRKVIKGEFEDSARRSIQEWMSEIRKYDVISFDVFDTLVLRKVDYPDCVFDLVGIKLGIDDFRTVRKMAENKTKDHVRFYGLEEIYRRMKRYVSIDPEKGAKAEFDMEIGLTCANPYIKELVSKARLAGKKVIAVSDTYLEKSQIEALLQNCGYDPFDEIYSSLTCMKDKESGELFEKVKNDFPAGTHFLHIGDNLNSDVNRAEEKGFSTWKYSSVFEEGRNYRPLNSGEDITGAVTNALINNEIHNGLTRLSPLEQYGFIYGGTIVAGYCDWLQRIQKEYRFDSMIFLSRDAKVFYDNYSEFYHDPSNCVLKYAYVSRAVMIKMLVKEYPSLFVHKVLKPYSFSGKLTISEVLKETELKSLLDILQKKGISGEQKFTTKTVTLIEQYVYKYKDIIDASYESQKEAAKEYWIDKIGPSKRILLVDDGLHGTIFVCLEKFLREYCGISVELYNAQLGTLKDSMNQRLIAEGKMLSYAFASDHNPELAALFANGIEVSAMESILSEDIGSLKGYSLSEDGNVQLDYYPANTNSSFIRQIHSGIRCFVRKYVEVKKDTGIQLYIEGNKAFEELLQIIQSPKYLDSLLGEYIYTTLPGIMDSEKKLHDWFKNEKYI